MISAELIADYRSIEKPFCLIERHAHCGGTDYATICRLTDEHARLLASEGIGWLYGEPDWQKHHDKIALLQAEKDKSETERRIAALTTKDAALPPAVSGQAEIDTDVTAADLGVNAEPAPTETCERCQGNGEIVTDWERYRHPHPGDKGDEAVAECPDCGGEGIIDLAPSAPTTRGSDHG